MSFVALTPPESLERLVSNTLFPYLCNCSLCRESFLKAMDASPHDKRIVSNFNALLAWTEDGDYTAIPTVTAHDEYIAWIGKK